LFWILARRPPFNGSSIFMKCSRHQHRGDCKFLVFLMDQVH